MARVSRQPPVVAWQVARSVQRPSTSTVGVQTSLGDVTIRTMARFIQGTCGLANIDNDDRIRAEDVTYDNSDGLYPPGTDTVQLALEAAGGGASVAEMTPTVAGTAYGLQDDAKELNSLGRDVSLTATRSTARYLSAGGAPQDATYTSSIYDSNRSGQDATTNLSNAIASINETDLTTASLTASTVIANTSTLTNVPCGNSVLQLNTTNASAATLLDSTVLANSSSIASANLDKTVLLATRLNAASVPMEGGVFIGDGSNAVVTQLKESVFIGSSSGAVVSQAGQRSLYVGNQSSAETVNDREAWISSFDRFYLRTLRADAAPLDVCFYNAGTAEVTYGPPPAPILSTTTISSAWFPVMYNPSTNVLAYANGTRISRVWRQQGTTDLNGSITFNPGGLITVNAANNAINATVVSTSTTIAYTCSISNIISGTFSIQVFQSTNAILGSATMVRAGSGLVVHVTLAY